MGHLNGFDGVRADEHDVVARVAKVLPLKALVLGDGGVNVCAEVALPDQMPDLTVEHEQGSA